MTQTIRMSNSKTIYKSNIDLGTKICNQLAQIRQLIKDKYFFST